MSNPQNLSDLLQARLKLSLFNWAKRTLLWTAALGLLTTQVPPVRFLLIGWILFSAISLVGLLLGLKIAGKLKTKITFNFPQSSDEPRNVSNGRGEIREEETDLPPVQGRRTAVNDEIIDIEAEVLPPEHK